eukprot:COSAG02_NODE_10762_length_1863_cov_1.383787_2_plen_276_part_00
MPHSEYWWTGSDATGSFTHAKLDLDPTDNSQPILIDLDSPKCWISRVEFQIMMTEYWTSRKQLSVDIVPDTDDYSLVDMTKSTDMIRPENANPLPESTPADTHHHIRVSRIAGKDRAAHEGGQTICFDCSLLKRLFCKAPVDIDIAEDKDVVPPWLSDIAKGHEVLSQELRGPEVFWKILMSRMQQVVIRAHGKGITAGDPVKTSTADKLEAEAKAAMKHWHIRAIGSSDGSQPPSSFSIVWDLMQVMLLTWVLMSVPFVIAFNIDVPYYSFVWW